MVWKLLYKGFIVEGDNGQDECIVHFETPQFSWQTMHPSYRSAQVCITKFLKQQNNKENQQ